MELLGFFSEGKEIFSCMEKNSNFHKNASLWFGIISTRLQFLDFDP